MATKPTIRMDLTPEQQDMVKRATGKPVTTFEVNLDGIEELEDRIAPMSMNTLSLNVNTVNLNTIR
jgi:hypothetical protein